MAADPRAQDRGGSGRPPATSDKTKADERPAPAAVPETGGPKGPEPTRYGDWEKGGRCTDF